MTLILSDCTLADCAKQPAQNLHDAVLHADAERVKWSMREAIIVHHFKDAKRYRELGCETFEEWLETAEIPRSTGYQLAAAGAKSTIVDCPSHARELTGLDDATAAKVVNETKAAGPVTAARIRETRAVVVADNRRAAERAASEDWLGDVRRWCAKGRRLFRRQVGTEKADEFIEGLEALARDVAG